MIQKTLNFQLQKKIRTLKSHGFLIYIRVKFKIEYIRKIIHKNSSTIKLQYTGQTNHSTNKLQYTLQIKLQYIIMGHSKSARERVYFNFFRNQVKGNSMQQRYFKFFKCRRLLGALNTFIVFIKFSPQTCTYISWFQQGIQNF